METNKDNNNIALFIKDSAHHLDLRLPNNADPDSVKDARNIEMTEIKKWIADYKKNFWYILII